MKLSVFYSHVKQAAIQRGISLDEAFEYAHSCGIEGLDFDYFDFSDDEAGLVALLKKHQLSVACIFRFYNFPEVEFTQADLSLYDLAARVGCKVVMPLPCVKTGDDVELAWDRMISAEKQMLAYGETLGICTGMEDFDGAESPFRYMSGVRRLMDSVDRFGCVFDTGNFAFADEDEIDAFELLKDRVYHVHLKDRLFRIPSGMTADDGETTLGGRPLFACSVGKGEIRIAEILRRLKAIGYDGYLGMEFFGVKDYYASIAESAEFVRSCL